MAMPENSCDMLAVTHSTSQVLNNKQCLQLESCAKKMISKYLTPPMWANCTECL